MVGKAAFADPFVPEVAGMGKLGMGLLKGQRWRGVTPGQGTKDLFSGA